MLEVTVSKKDCILLLQLCELTGSVWWCCQPSYGSLGGTAPAANLHD